MAAIIKLSQNEWVKYILCKWWGGKCEWSLFCANGGNQSWQVWVSLREKTKVAESKMAEFKMVASWVKMNKSQIESLSQSRVEGGWEKKTRCLNPRWQNSRWLPSSSWVRMNEWSFLIQHGRIQDGCHHQVESEWMSKVLFFQMVGREVWVKSFLCKWWEPILASVSEFERKN